MLTSHVDELLRRQTRTRRNSTVRALWHLDGNVGLHDRLILRRHDEIVSTVRRTRNGRLVRWMDTHWAIYGIGSMTLGPIGSTCFRIRKQIRSRNDETFTKVTQFTQFKARWPANHLVRALLWPQQAGSIKKHNQHNELNHTNQFDSRTLRKLSNFEIQRTRAHTSSNRSQRPAVSPWPAWRRSPWAS